MSKKPVNVRLDRATLAAFDALPGTRTEKLEAAMQLYLNRKDDVEQRKVTEALEVELAHREEIIAGLRAHVLDLQQQLGFLRAALPAPKRHWWSGLRR
jgi:hypothetical protein